MSISHLQYGFDTTQNGGDAYYKVDTSAKMYHVVVIWNGDTLQDVSMYVDGQPVALTVTNPSAAINTASSTYAYIGAAINSSGVDTSSLFIGYIGAMRMYNRVLTQDEVT